MTLRELIGREMPPRPWAEGEKIPWNDPAFSGRMLREHLSQDHDLASRRQTVIDRHVRWIHETCLNAKPERILDLGCGPGFYAERLARLGHRCVGIDFSPASVAYATSQAARAGLPNEYRCEDIRSADYGNDFGLAVLVFGEFNVFRRADAERLLSKIFATLRAGGMLVLEPHTYAMVEAMGRRPASWRAAANGLFSARPHVCLEESFWDDDAHATTIRYFIIDAETGEANRYASTMQAYSEAEYDAMLAAAGLRAIRRLPSLSGSEEDRHEGLFVLTAVKPGGA